MVRPSIGAGSSVGPISGLGSPWKTSSRYRRDVDGAERRLPLPRRHQLVAQPVRQVGAARPDADQVQRPFSLRDALGDLVRHPAQRARDAGGVEQLAPFLQVAVGRWLAGRHQR